MYGEKKHFLLFLVTVKLTRYIAQILQKTSDFCFNKFSTDDHSS